MLELDPETARTRFRIRNTLIVAIHSIQTFTFDTYVTDIIYDSTFPPLVDLLAVRFVKWVEYDVTVNKADYHFTKYYSVR